MPRVAPCVAAAVGVRRSSALNVVDRAAVPSLTGRQPFVLPAEGLILLHAPRDGLPWRL